MPDGSVTVKATGERRGGTGGSTDPGSSGDPHLVPNHSICQGTALSAA